MRYYRAMTHRYRHRVPTLIAALAALLLALAGPAPAEEPPQHGLMWNRTGLPLVFPLLVQTDPGMNYHVLLQEAETGKPAVAAFIEGGRHFRLLVPPGKYRLRFSYGKDWVDETALFGPRTGSIVLKEPLDFRVTGFNAKGGYLLDLRGRGIELGAIDARPEAICQMLALAPWPRTEDSRRAAASEALSPSEEGLLTLRGPLEVQAAVLALDLSQPENAVPGRPVTYRFEVLSRRC